MLKLGKRKKAKTSTCYYSIFENGKYIGHLRVSNHHDFNFRKNMITFLNPKPEKVSKKKLEKWVNEVADKYRKTNLDIFGNVI